MNKNICFRGYGCAIRSHHHCKYSCHEKHTFGEICEISQIPIILNQKLNKKLNQKQILDKVFVENLIKKYNISNNLKKLFIESSYFLSKVDMNFVRDTFLSEKAITKEVSVDWIRKFLDISHKKEYEEIRFFLIIILWYELTTSNRHLYIMNHDKFKETLKMKYDEFCENSNPLISTFFRNEIKI